MRRTIRESAIARTPAPFVAGMSSLLRPRDPEILRENTFVVSAEFRVMYEVLQHSWAWLAKVSTQGKAPYRASVIDLPISSRGEWSHSPAQRMQRAA